MLDHLHGAGIEIVSPNFINSRQLDPKKSVIPEKLEHKATEEEGRKSVEEKVFDKAEVASEKELLLETRGKLLDEIKKSAEENNDAKLAQLQLAVEAIDIKLREIEL